MEDLIRQFKRVIKVSRKPDRSEYLDVAKVTGIGILIIGAVGFIVMIVSVLLGGSTI